MDAPRIDVTDAALTISVSPTGHVRVEPDPGVDFGRFVLWLGATQVGQALPPGPAFLRDLGKAFVTRLCGVPELEVERGRVRLLPPDRELAALAAAVPPIAGAEYVDVARLHEWWEELRGAFREEIERWDGTVQAWLHA